MLFVAVTDGESSERSLTEGDESVDSLLNSSQARPSLLSCKNSYTTATQDLLLNIYFL